MTEPPAVMEAVAEELARRVDASERELARRFARLFYAKAPADLFHERDVATLSLMALGAFRFLLEANDEHTEVQVLNPAHDAEPWAAPVTVIRTRVTERPFVVDTIREYLHARELAIERIIYPVLRVVRDASQRVIELGSATEGSPRESLPTARCRASAIRTSTRR